ncbi:uncharacterized protein LOC143289554 [Babylonia areolata]|uniref:uncharacterized protein LOC143289554 n=1 Tax=Babylonia areolata TaxID=304850 RepID=UPI003FCFE619
MAQGEKSETSAGAVEGKGSLPDGWIVRVSRSHPDRVYYFNTVTGSSTWNLPELTQSSGKSRKSKKKHRHKSKKKHRANENNTQGQQNPEPLQQTSDDEPDDDDDDVLDLTCENDAEPDFVLSAPESHSADSTHNSVSHSDRTDDRQPMAKGQKVKKKWKKLWDSPCGLKPQANSSSSNLQEEHALSAEELQIIRFPKCSHAKGLGENSAVSDQRDTAQGTHTPSSGDSICLWSCADANMGNIMKRSGDDDKLSQTPISSTSVVEKPSAEPLGHGSKRAPGSGGTARTPNVPPRAVAVEYRSGVKPGKKPVPVPSLPENKPPQDKRKKMVESSESVVGVGQGVKSCPGKRAGLKAASQSDLSSAGSVSLGFVPRVLTTVKSANTAAAVPSSASGNVSSSGKDAGNVISDVNKGTTGRAHRTGDGAADDAQTSADKLRLTRKRDSQAMQVTSRGNAASRSEATSPTTLPACGLSPLSTPVNRKEENSAVSTPTSEVLDATSQDAQNDRPVIKAKRRKRRSCSKSKSEESAPQSPLSTLSPLSGSKDASAALNRPSQSAPLLADSFHPRQTLSKDPASSAFTVVQPQSRHRAVSPLDRSEESLRPSSRSPLTTVRNMSGGFHSASSSPFSNSQPPTPEPGTSLKPGHCGLGTALTPVTDHSGGLLMPGVNAFPITPDSAGGVDSGVGATWVREEEDDMEIDNDSCCDDPGSDDDHIMMDLHELREKFQPDIKTEVVGVLTESVQKTHPSRPITPLSPLGPTTKLVYVVVDTNIFIGELDTLKHLRDMTLKDYGRPYLIIPWVVLQELDGLKMSWAKSRRAQNAVRYIHSCLINLHPRVRGQTPAEASEPVDNFRAQCNDDRILQCCLQCQRKHGGSSVMLLTDDMNLENKAVVMGIRTFSTKRLQPLLGTSTLDDDYPPLTDAGAPSNASSAKVPRRTGQQQSDADTGRSTLPASVPASSAAVRRKKPQRRESGTSVVNSPQLHQQRRAADELLCGGKAVVSSALGDLVKREMREAYDDLWLELVVRKPPWSPHDLVLILQKHWMAVFTMKLDMGLKPIIDDLVRDFNPGRGVSLELRRVLTCLQTCLRLVEGVSRLGPYGDCVKRLNSLIQKGAALLQESGQDSVGTQPSVSTPGPQQSPTGLENSNASTSSTRNDNDRYGNQSLPPTTAPSLSSSPSSSSLTSSTRSDNRHGNRSLLTTTPPLSSASSARAATTSARATTSSSVPVREGTHSARQTEEWGPNVSRSETRPQPLPRRRMSSGDGGDQRKSPPPVGMRNKIVKEQIQVPKSNTAEENAAIGEVFQGIWSAVFNCCENVEKMKEATSGSADLLNVKDTLLRLIPLALQLQETFKKCLAFSPCILDQQVSSVSALCSCLNTFFDSANIPAATPRPRIAPGNMVVFMCNTENRVPLRNGLEQLDGMVGRLQKLISWVSSVV